MGNHRGVTIGEAAIIAIAGVWAGMINTVVGSGTLVTFPVLLVLGFPPLTANVSNGLGLVLGSLTGAIGYRRELRGLRGRVLRLAVPSMLGALLGALLLLVLPSAAFDEVVPVLVALGGRARRDRAVGVEAGGGAGHVGGAADEGAPCAGRCDVRDRGVRGLLRCRAGRAAARFPGGSCLTTTCSGTTR